jgi:hypothetical protein
MKETFEQTQGTNAIILFWRKLRLHRRKSSKNKIIYAKTV